MLSFIMFIANAYLFEVVVRGGKAQLQMCNKLNYSNAMAVKNQSRN